MREPSIEELRAALQLELERRQKEERLRFWNQDRRHLKQATAFASPKRLQGVFGGNRSGKTVFGGVRTTLFSMGAHAEPYIEDWCDEDKDAWWKFYGQMKDPIEMWCGTINWDVHRDITQPELLKWMPAAILAKSDIVMRRKGVIDYILFPWKSRLTFKSYDSGREAFQGKSLRYLWLDEEPEPEIWFESKMRLVDQKGFATLTMTPLKGLTWAYNEIYMNEAQDAEVEAHQFTWDDNPWLDDDEKNRIMASMTEDEISARKFGEFISSGASVLSRTKLSIRRRELINVRPEARMSWVEDKGFALTPDGDLEIYQEPIQGRFYIIGADVAEGLPSGDNSTAEIIDAKTAKQVAELVVRIDTTTFSKQLAWLGRKYNLAMIAPERNNNGHSVIQTLDNVINYPAIYKHEDDRYGWPENSVTRPIVVSFMQDFVRDSVDTINSKGLIDEGLTFVRDSSGRPQAAGKGKPGGQKDDRLFGWGIALAVREQYGPPLTPVRAKLPMSNQPKQDKWAAQDMDEDVDREAFARFDPALFANFDMPGEGS